MPSQDFDHYFPCVIRDGAHCGLGSRKTGCGGQILCRQSSLSGRTRSGRRTSRGSRRRSQRRHPRSKRVAVGKELGGARPVRGGEVKRRRHAGVGLEPGNSGKLVRAKKMKGRAAEWQGKRPRVIAAEPSSQKG